MTTLAQAKREAAKYGAELFVNRQDSEAEVWLPEGQLWQSTASRCIVVSFGYKGSGVMSGVYSYLMEDMAHGIA